MSPRAFMPTGATGPVYRRLAGLHALLIDATLRLRALQATAEDIQMGVLSPVADEAGTAALFATALAMECRTLDLIGDRLRELSAELARDQRQ